MIDLILLEIDDKLLPDVLHQRGQPNEDAVLCTQSKTYSIKFVGNSNSVFLIPPVDQSALHEHPQYSDEKDDDQRVVASVIKVAPGGLRERGIGRMEEQKTNLFKWNDLIDRVQASDDELRSGLRALSAVEIDGYWRIVDEKYMDALGEDEVVGVLESDVVYGSWMRGAYCIHFAREILKDGKRKMESFMEEWIQKIPDGMQASFDMLEGEVLTEKFGVETWVRAFSVSSLPSNPAARFSMLFQERPKWSGRIYSPI
ncbi:Sister chromatid cohesion protein DCC1 [Vitis vinifera]|uniref:Sister chromatid cohesion protein DCC1 n=1 Tax=Vitis vinifera TaxID=29760 RepID=A0A438CHY7_VITVI|nr:Sister chromatid cohesion protein DCC1 [Vitis vinifera]